MNTILRMHLIICFARHVKDTTSTFSLTWILFQSLTDGNVREDEPPSCRFQVDMSPKRDIELSVKVLFQSWHFVLFNILFIVSEPCHMQVMLQLLEVSCDLELFLSLWEPFTVLKSFEFQLERVSFYPLDLVLSLLVGSCVCFK